MRWLALTIMLAAGPVLAQAIDAGAPDGAERTAYRERSFDTYALPIGPFGPGEKAVQTLEGQVTWSAYRIGAAPVSAADVMAGYAERLAEMGFTPLFECTGADCGGFDFRFGASLLPPPAMLFDVQNFAQMSARRATPEGYVSVLVSQVNRDLYVQTVTVVPQAPSAIVTESPEVEAGTEAAILPRDERALVDKLLADGHVPVEGLSFATGGASLTPESGEALDLLARMLSRDAELVVAIVGHSDNEGGLDPNIALSTKRAQAVMLALIARGVPKGQLEARGVGYLAPVTSNASPEGRALNRRVELVLR